MPDDPKALTRKELSEFLPSQRAIRAFEKLFDLIPSAIQAGAVDAESAAARAQQAADLITTAVQDAAINSSEADRKAAQGLSETVALLQLVGLDGAADRKATQALDQLERMAQSLELIAAQPPVGAVQQNAEVLAWLS